jgi:hypothetical protein
MTAEQVNARAVQDIRTRAAFEMRCDAAGLKFTPLGVVEGYGYVTQYGVDGCGQRLVYVRAPTGVWVLNTASHSKEEKNSQ